MNLVLGPLTNCSLHSQLALDTLKLNHITCLLSMGLALSTCTKLQLFHCHGQEKTILTIDFREMRSELTEESIVNKWLCP